MGTVYHVTSAKGAEDIIANGFKGGWGDAGFGIYFYGQLHNALGYLADGGWDGKLDPETAVVIAVEVDDAELEFVIPDHSWPNPEDYDDVLWFPMDDSVSEKWQPPREMVGMSAAPAVAATTPQP